MTLTLSLVIPFIISITSCFVGILAVLMGINSQIVLGWHQDLGMSDEKAAQLYQTNPNDPQILKWSNALQLEYEQDKQFCFEPHPYTDGIESLDKMQKESCNVLLPIINDNCIHHPNSTLLCSDSRIAAWIQNMN